MSNPIERAYDSAKDRYAEHGVDVESAMRALAGIPISLHCWQGDDVGGFEQLGTGLGGGLAATGNYPGKARTPDELRSDAEKAFSLIPGRHRFNLHAFYGDFDGRRVDRDRVGPEHFSGWIDWARRLGIGLDFNPTFFSHPNAADNFTLSHAIPRSASSGSPTASPAGASARAIGEALGNTCITNFWIPDGMKDTPVDRVGPRERVLASLDAIFDENIDPAHNRDAVEGKLFGIGCESYTVGSHEFYYGYALTRGKLLTLDSGHYHPTETVTDKISSVLMFLPELLLHVSRGVRWDSDHVVVLNDELEAMAQELVRGQFLDRVHIGLDYFDASINRVAAWTIGTRNMIKALLKALLEPTAALRTLEAHGDYTGRLALLEEVKTLPFGAIWDRYCESSGVPVGPAWLREVQSYEQRVLALRA